MSDELTERVAKAIWRVRRQNAKDIGVALEPWGDGSIPRANHVLEEADAAIRVIWAYGEELMAAHSLTHLLPTKN